MGWSFGTTSRSLHNRSCGIQTGYITQIVHVKITLEPSFAPFSFPALK